MTTATNATHTSASPLGRHRMHDYQHLLTRHRVGPLDRLPAHEILAQLPETPAWSSLRRNRRLEAIRGASTVLDWLHTHDGGGWQDRWVNSG
ncbi:hypothetical protein BAY59_33950 [Prauserella coralliicola]|nr:hypothetical protein BAY59_33950 [Prauserella coralliicola]